MPFSERLRIALVVLLLCAAAAGPSPKAAENQPTFVDLKGGAQQPLKVVGAKAHVLFFITHECPIANSYAPEIKAIVKDHADKPLRFYIIHVDPDLTPAEARKHAAEFGLPAPILLDTQHQLVKAMGATITPEVAVLTPDGKLAYRGRIDDVYPEVGKQRPAPTRRDLREALSAVLAGKPIEPARTQAVGCFIPELK